MTEHIDKSTELDLLRFEGDGGPPIPERTIGKSPVLAAPYTPGAIGATQLSKLSAPGVDIYERAAEAIYEREPHPAPEDILPLAPPARPDLFGDMRVRIAFFHDDRPDVPVALELDFNGEDQVMAAAKLAPGRIEMSFINGFGRTRTLQLSPAEYLLVLRYGERFFSQLPRDAAPAGE